MRTNCENCIGETRIACDAIFTELRGAIADSTPAILDAAENDRILDVMNIQVGMSERSSDARDKLAFLGCSLGEAALISAFLSEASAGLFLGISDEEEKEQKAAEDRLDDLLAESRVLLAEAKNIRDQSLKDIESSRAEETEAYCLKNSWDPDNLRYDQRLEIKMHLKKLGLRD